MNLYILIALTIIAILLLSAAIPLLLRAMWLHHEIEQILKTLRGDEMIRKYENWASEFDKEMDKTVGPSPLKQKPL
jgi:hypothetical protein